TPHGPDPPPHPRRLDDMTNNGVRAGSNTTCTPGSARRTIFFGCTLLVLTFFTVGCGRATKPAEEKVPPAPVKWEGLRQLFLEEWTELVGTTQPLPDHAARVTSPVAGRVLEVLPKSGAKEKSGTKEIVEGQE